MFTQALKPQPKREKKSKTRIAKRSDNLEAELDEIWRHCIYLQDNFTSRLSGIQATVLNDRIYGINAHHRIRKPNHNLRYSLDNGVTILGQEHEDIHFQKSPTQFLYEARNMVTPEHWEKLMALKRDNTKISLVVMRDYLTSKRQELIERAMTMADSQLLKVFLKQIGVAK